MGNIEKDIFIYDYIQFQMILENCYHEKARGIYKNMCKELKEFYLNRKITKYFYKRNKKRLEKYWLMYEGQEIRKEVGAVRIFETENNVHECHKRKGLIPKFTKSSQLVLHKCRK